MSREDVFNEVQEIFRDIFDDDDLTINDDTTAADIHAWDSLTNVNLMSAVERHYKIRFALGELASMKNVGEMVDLILKKTA